MNNQALYQVITDNVKSEQKVLVQKWIEGYREAILLTLPNDTYEPVAITNIKHKLLNLGIQVVNTLSPLNHTRFMLFPSMDQDYVDLITVQQEEADRLGSKLNVLYPELDRNSNDSKVKFKFVFDNITNNDFGLFKGVEITRVFECPAYHESNKLTDASVNFILGAIYDILQ